MKGDIGEEACIPSSTLTPCQGSAAGRQVKGHEGLMKFLATRRGTPAACAQHWNHLDLDNLSQTIEVSLTLSTPGTMDTPA